MFLFCQYQIPLLYLNPKSNEPVIDNIDYEWNNINDQEFDNIMSKSYNEFYNDQLHLLASN